MTMRALTVLPGHPGSARLEQVPEPDLRGIKELDGYACEHFRIEPEFVVKVDPELKRVGVLLEPTSIVAKAWEQIDLIGARLRWRPRRALITGAGPIGLLGALLAAQRGLDANCARLSPKSNNGARSPWSGQRVTAPGRKGPFSRR
jgi:hypothetical protein